MEDYTRPVPGLHFNQPENEALQGHLSSLSKLLDRLSVFGTHVLSWQTDPDIDQPDAYHRSAKYQLTHHLLGQLDAIYLLVRAGSSQPCRVMMRAILETHFGIEYMHESDTYNRGMAYIVSNMHDRINWYGQFDTDTDFGKNYLKILKAGGVRTDPPLPLDEIRRRIKKLTEKLNTPMFQETEEAWQIAKRRRKGQLRWYSLYNGPTSIIQLAQRLKLEHWYEIFYRDWSGDVHAQLDSGSSTMAGPDDLPVVRPIRFPMHLSSLTVMTVTLVVASYRTIIRSSFPSKEAEFVEWYANKVRSSFHAAMKFESLDVSFTVQPNKD